MSASMQVPLLDLRLQYAPIREEIRDAVDGVFESQRFINGPQVKELEEAVAAFSSCRHAIAVSSGTDALLCSLMGLGIGPGDEVITTPYTFFATVGSIWRCGAKPVFVDIRSDTYNIDTDRIEKALTARTRAILPVHLFGQCAEMDAVVRIAQEHNLFVIEDAAQSIGATYKGRQAGSMGTAGCLSFFPSKNLGGFGDGGMIITQDDQLAERLAVLRQHGSRPKYYHRLVGGNFRLDTVQAAGLLVKLKYLERWSAQRRENAKLYDQLLGNLKHVVIPSIADGNVSIYNQYIIRAGRHRNGLMEHLRRNGIGTEVYYPLGMHEQECFKPLGYSRGDFPECERAAAETLALPIFPELTEEQIRYVAQTIESFVS